MLLYYNINDTVVKNQDSLTLALDTVGINKIEAYVEVANNAAIKSDPIKVQIINNVNNATFDKTLYAINEVSKGVNNWEFSKLYKLSIYFKGQD